MGSAILLCPAPGRRPPSQHRCRDAWGSGPHFVLGRFGGELLVGNSYLALYSSTSSTPACSWQKRLASPIRCAALSYDSAYVASVGQHDRLVKLWRRLTYGSDDVRFDLLYLPHPAVVTSLQWRKPHHVDHTVDNILYTFCADSFLRVWTRSDSHSNQYLRLWGKVDLAASIPSMAMPDAAPAAPPWAFIIQGRDLSAATERAVQDGGDGEKDGVALQDLINIANRSSEVCVVLDARGVMSALSLENVGSVGQKTNDVFNIAQFASRDLDFSQSLPSTADAHVEVYNYCDRSGGHLCILVHFFYGEIQVYEANIARLFDESCTGRRLWKKAVWSGHSAPIRKMVRNFSGRAIVSRTALGESVVWKHALYTGDPVLRIQSMLPEAGHIHRICVLRKGRFVVFLFYDRLVVWDCRRSTPTQLAACAYSLPGKPLCLLILPRQRADDRSVAHIATITSEKRGIVWELALPSYASSASPPPPAVNGHGKPSIREVQSFELDDAGDLAYVLPVDPAGSTPIISGFLDVFARDVAISYTHSGRLSFGRLE